MAVSTAFNHNYNILLLGAAPREAAAAFIAPATDSVVLRPIGGRHPRQVLPDFGGKDPNSL